jgi:hypothetical protein
MMPPPGFDVSGSQPQTRQLQRDEAALVELTSLRHSEVLTISTRLGRCCRRGFDWERVWGSLALLFFGGVAGGFFGGFPLWAANPAHQTKVYYVLAVASAAVLGVAALIARLAIHKERVESIEAIKEDLDAILASYPTIANSGIGSPIS